MSDTFLTQTICSRCPNELKVRKLSWFNDDVLCPDCIEKEQELKRELRKNKIDTNKLEGCGYIPSLKSEQK